jgi:hypothetical protein
MQRRKFLVLIGGPHLFMSSAPAFADSSGQQLASYYDRHMALLDGVAYGWTGRGVPVRMRDCARQVGVSQDAFSLCRTTAGFSAGAMSPRQPAC